MRPLKFGFNPAPHVARQDAARGKLDGKGLDLMVHPSTGEVFQAPASARAQVEAANAAATRGARMTRTPRTGSGRNV